MKLCTIEDCTRPLRARGWCATHWSRWQRHGDPLHDSPRGPRPTEPSERFWPKVNRTSGCWLWTGATIRGYGAFNLGRGRVVYAHRFAYELMVGRIPDGLTLDHLCREPLCVNPSHLEAVTAVENVRRAIRIGYDHPSAPVTCRRGHDWSVTPPLLAHRSDGSVTRQCRVCVEDREAAS